MKQLLFILLLSSSAFAAESGSIEVPADYQTQDGSKLKLEYQWFSDDVEPSRPTILLLHGGPGMGSRAITQTLLADELLDNPKYNLFTFEQRGSLDGLHDLKANNISIEDAPKTFNINQMVEDIEYLRKNVIRQDKIIILGHSFGGSLGYLYSSKYPAHVSKLIILSGAQDGLGFTTQGSAQVRLFIKTLKQVFSNKQIAELLQAIKDNRLYAVDPKDGRKIHLPLEYIVEFINSDDHIWVKNYLKDIKKYKVIEGSNPNPELTNLDQVEKFLNQIIAKDLSSSFKESEVEVSAADFIVCQNFITPTTIKQSVAAGWDMQSTQAYYDYLCGRLAKYQLKDEPLTIDIRMLPKKTLVIAGTNDFKPPISILLDQFNKLKQNSSLSRMVMITNANHRTPDQKCAVRSIMSFLNDSLTSAVTVCGYSQEEE